MCTGRVPSLTRRSGSESGTGVHIFQWGGWQTIGAILAVALNRTLTRILRYTGTNLNAGTHWHCDCQWHCRTASGSQPY